jgi:hypothetical protein
MLFRVFFNISIDEMIVEEVVALPAQQRSKARTNNIERIWNHVTPNFS